MYKILVCDNRFNVESISSCSTLDSRIKFFGENNKLSFFDNYDSIKPDMLWINESFAQSAANIAKQEKLSVIIYNIPYIIPNVFSNVSEIVPGNGLVCLISNPETKLKNMTYKDGSTFLKFYSLDANLHHIQHIGKINSCKDLTQIISSQKQIISDSSLFDYVTSFYKRTVGRLESSGSILWHNKPVEHIVTNKELFLNHVNQ